MIDYMATRLNFEGQKRFYVESKAAPFKYGILTRPQADLARAIGEGKHRIFLMTSGNGAGKSAELWNIVSNMVFPNCNIYRDITDVETGETFPGFFNYPFFRNYPANWPKSIWYVTNGETIKSDYEEFQNWIPEGLYTAHKDGKTYVSRIQFIGTRWTIFFKTIDQDPKTFEGANVGVVIFNEPPPRQLYIASLVRLRKGGIVIIAATPLFGSAYFKDDIIDDPTNFWQKVPVWSNCVEKAGSWDLGPFGVQKKGNLYEKDIEFILQKLRRDPDEAAAREFGEMGVYVGLVYKTYNSEKHFVKLPPVVTPQKYMYQFVLDPHDRKPPMACWIRCDEYGRKRVIREWPSISDPQYNFRPFHEIKNSSPYRVEDFVKFFVKIFREIGVDPDRCQAIIDPNFGKKPNSTTGTMVFEDYQIEFEKQGFPIHFVTDVIDNLATGHTRVKDYLYERSDGDFGLLIDKSCYNIDYSFRNYSYDDHEGKTRDKKGLKEDVKDIYKDPVDLIRYACMSHFTYVAHRLDRRSDKTDYDEVKIEDWRKGLKDRPRGAAGV